MYQQESPLLAGDSNFFSSLFAKMAKIASQGQSRSCV